MFAENAFVRTASRGDKHTEIFILADKGIINIIFEETASYTCSLIFRILYSNLGTLESWSKNSRIQLNDKSLLVIGAGNIGKRVVNYMKPLMHVITFDILENDISDLPTLISIADCITLHIPKTDENNSCAKGFCLEHLHVLQHNTTQFTLCMDH